MKKPVKVYLLSLGCAKNLVNSEQMLGKLKNAGMELLDSPEGADAAIVNTCGFIDSAKTEAIEAILDLAELKKQGKLRALIAAGCLTQRYAGEFLKELPEVDAVLSQNRIQLQELTSSGAGPGRPGAAHLAGPAGGQLPHRRPGAADPRLFRLSAHRRGLRQPLFLLRHSGHPGRLPLGAHGGCGG